MKQSERKYYEKGFKQKIVRLHLSEGRTVKSLTAEYNISSGSVYNWIKKYRNDYRIDTQPQKEYDFMAENQKLKRQLEEVRKENEVLKNNSGILCKGSQIALYDFITAEKKTFGLRWLLRRLNIYPNSYYSYIRRRG